MRGAMDAATRQTRSADSQTRSPGSTGGFLRLPFPRVSKRDMQTEFRLISATREEAQPRGQKAGARTRPRRKTTPVEGLGL